MSGESHGPRYELPSIAVDEQDKGGSCCRRRLKFRFLLAKMMPVTSSINHWWQNWSKTHAYVAGNAFFPTSVDEIVDAVQAAEAQSLPVRAVGGGWSFTEASLPGNVATNRPDFNTVDQIAGELPLAEGFPPDGQPSIASLQANNATLIAYDSNNNRVVGGGAAHVGPLEALLATPQPEPAGIIVTSSLRSQLPLSDILSRAGSEVLDGTGRFYFHVEAGITMDALAMLLDMQSPRLQLGATGGNPGATLAGTISTATHGAEFNQDLLIDRVRAIHLVGASGQQWWIEGDQPVASAAKLRAKYPGIHVIAGRTHVNGLAPQDWLNAAVVSMGSFGVIYSVVIEVFGVGGNEQVTSQSQWLSFLGQVGTALPGSPSAAQVLAILRNPADPSFVSANTTIGSAVTAQAPFVGQFNGGIIGPGENFYADLAFNPNPIRRRGSGAGERDIWIVNRRVQPIPFDEQPPSTGGFSAIINAIFNHLKTAFNNDVPALVLRLQEIYALVDPLHVDIPLPHADIPSLHADLSDKVDITPHIDATEPLDIAPHIDTGEHIDVGQHVDIGPHLDTSFGFHADVSVHADIAPHVDIAPHLDIAQHLDIAPHLDVGQHVDIAPHVDVDSPHIDLTPGDINFTLQGLLLSLVNPLFAVFAALFGFFDDAADVLGSLILLPFDLGPLLQIINRITGATDTLDVALGELTGPIAAKNAIDVAQPILTGLLASVLGTATSNPSVSIGTSVGSLGFPASGLVGAGIEIAIPVETAFGFLQSHILDKLEEPQAPLFGYISVRLCPQTSQLMGMQQWPTSVMIEVVSFGDAFGKKFMTELQTDVLAYIAQGNDAILHWGLENSQVTAAALDQIPALQRPVASNAAFSQIAAFRNVRNLIKSNLGTNPAGLFHVFDNAFTARVGF
jgi:hypothetical protein